MTDTINRRAVLTGTAASAVVAAVPASAAVAKPAPAGDLGTRYRDGVSSVATQMPRDARVWIDAARAAGLTVQLGHANGTPGVFTGYNDVPNDVRDFLQAWGNAIPTAEIVAELEAEKPGPNDSRLMELAYQGAMDTQQANATDPKLSDEEITRASNRAQAAFREMAELQPETWQGVWAQALAVRVDPDCLDNSPTGRMALRIAETINCPWRVRGEPPRPSRPVEGS